MRDRKISILMGVIECLLILAAGWVLIHFIAFGEYDFNSLIEGFTRIGLSNPELGATLQLYLLFGLLGMTGTFCFVITIITGIFHVRTDEELKIAKESKLLKKQYPYEVARLKISKLKTELKLKKIYRELEEYKK